MNHNLRGILSDATHAPEIPSNLSKENLENYLLFSTFSETLNLSKEQNLMDMEIPARSPARLFDYNAKGFSSTISSPMSDTSSFNEKNRSRSSISDESIFSQDMTESSNKQAKGDHLDYDELDLDKGEIEALLDELELDDDGESTAVCTIDAVITIVGEHKATIGHSTSSVSDRRTKTLSYIAVS